MAKPKYKQIKERILKSIEGQEPNTAILSEREISAKLQSSRMTVRRAIEELVEEGILYRDKNRGTFVGDEKLRKKATSLLTEEESDKNTYSILYFDIKSREEKEIYEKLNMRHDDLYVRLVRLVSSQSKPISVEEIFIDRKNMSDEEIKRSKDLVNIDRFLEEGIMNQVFNPMIVPIQYANLLKLKIDEPIIRVDSLISQKNGVPYIFIRSYYNPKYKKIEITL